MFYKRKHLRHWKHTKNEISWRAKVINLNEKRDIIFI